MTPATRAKLVRTWKRFSLAYEAFFFDYDEAVDVLTVGDVINIAACLNTLNRSRASYLSALTDAGILDPNDSCPDDHRLWELHPNNLTGEGKGDLYE
jgi:hypothetical protein